MNQQNSILIAGRDKSALQQIHKLFQGQSNLKIHVNHINNGHADPLYGIDLSPDLVVFHLSPAWEEELKSFAVNPSNIRPPLIAIGSSGDSHMLRLAMQTGARDFLKFPVDADELLQSTRQVLSESTRMHDRTGKVSVVMGARGGVGASFMACNLGHLLVTDLKLKVCLMDLDLQFGTLSDYLDIDSGNGLLESLGSIDDLDDLAIAGRVAKHESGLHLLASIPNRLFPSWEISEDDLEQLIKLMRHSYDHLLVDLPRQINAITGTAIESADHIITVMQQNHSDLRETKRLTQILKNDLAVPDHRIQIVVNRYHANSQITRQDIEGTLGIRDLMLIPNDFRNVSQALNAGVPILEHSPRSSVIRSLRLFSQELNGNKSNKRKSHSAFSLLGWIS